jgi:hypothetical protein
MPATPPDQIERLSETNVIHVNTTSCTSKVLLSAVLRFVHFGTPPPHLRPSNHSCLIELCTSLLRSWGVICQALQFCLGCSIAWAVRLPPDHKDDVMHCTIVQSPCSITSFTQNPHPALTFSTIGCFIASRALEACLRTCAYDPTLPFS